MEGGMITGEPRPDGVAEAGMTVSAQVPGRSWGFGASVEAVGRLTSRFDAAEEVKLDVTWRWSAANGRARGGLGGGARVLTLDTGQTIRGIDLTRLDLEVEAARWTVAATRVSVDFYVSWTFGCYHDDYQVMPAGDAKAETRAIRCGDTITTTYVAGFQTSVSWR
jgi:hypothetical protein